MSIQIIRSQAHDPYFNLALEDYLLRQMSGQEPVEGSLPQAILYLWQNQNTVVIGRNQNAWAECKTALLEEEGGRLARRTTGGGAVFHDLGNLNFSLLVPQKEFDVGRNFQMIVDTVRRAGIPAERSGRNDILADGLKFSGNAFRIDHGVGLHHGTLLISSAFERVGRYLTVAPAKLAAKGIASVRSRITNLSTFRPDLDVDFWKNELETVFAETFSDGQPVERKNGDDFRSDLKLTALEQHFASWNWRYGETLAFDAELAELLPWGHLQVGFKVELGHVTAVRIFSDALDCDWIAHIERELLGLPFSSAKLAETILSHEKMPGGFGISRAQMANELVELILAQGW
jgi:lipoate-protein ligase A